MHSTDLELEGGLYITNSCDYKSKRNATIFVLLMKCISGRTRLQQQKTGLMGDLVIGKKVKLEE